MKKVINHYRLEVPPGKYFIEDILDICELLASVSSRVKISTEQIEFESLEEVKEYKKPIKEMLFQSYDPYISVQIDTWVKIYSEEDTTLTRGVVEKIADLARQCVKPFNIKSNKLNFDVSTVTMVVILILWPVAGVYFFNNNNPVVGSLFFGSELLFSYWVWYTGEKRTSTIRLVPKQEAPNFFKANSDKIIIAAIAAIVGALATAFITFLRGGIGK